MPTAGQKPEPFAIPHTALERMPDAVRVGGLVWWSFHNGAADVTELADGAMAAQLPTLFLPLPHPVSQSVAFHRMIRAADRMIDDQRWHGNAIDKHQIDKHQVEIPEPVATWRPDALFGIAQLWQPEQLERLRVRLWIAFDPRAPELPTTDVVRFFMESKTGDEPRWIDITDHAVEKAEKVAANLIMAQQLYEVLNRERILATSAEIGDGINEALTEVGGVKLHPCLYVMPGEAGVVREEAVLGYLDAVADTDTGNLDLFQRKTASQLAGLIRPTLEAEIERLQVKIDKLGDVGVGALRSRWLELEDQRRRLDLNAELLGAAAGELTELLNKARQTLLAKARAKGLRLGKEVDLAAKPGAAVQAHLRKGFDTICEGSEPGDVNDRREYWKQVKSQLAAADKELSRGQSAARCAGCGLLIRRLRKLLAATLHAFDDRAHGDVETAGERAMILHRALVSGVGYIRGRCSY